MATYSSRRGHRLRSVLRVIGFALLGIPSALAAFVVSVEGVRPIVEWIWPPPTPQDYTQPAETMQALLSHSAGLFVVFTVLGLLLSPETRQEARRLGLNVANPVSVWLGFTVFYFLYNDGEYLPYISVLMYWTTAFLLGPALGVAGMRIANWIRRRREGRGKGTIPA